jgi:hypothetical protein
MISKQTPSYEANKRYELLGHFRAYILHLIRHLHFWGAVNPSELEVNQNNI